MSVCSPRTSRSLVLALPLFVIALVSMGLPSAAFAQAEPKHWGVSASFVPEWTIHDKIRPLFFDEDTEGSIDGSEFSIGFVRGQVRGGDFGVSLIRKPWNDGSGSTETSTQCFNQAQTICRQEIEKNETQGVFLQGVEAHWFLGFVKIQRRAQIGLNVAVGIAAFNGDVVKTTDGFRQTGFSQGQPILTPFHEVEVNPAKDELLPFFPIFKLEAEGDIVVAPGLKVKIAGGMNFPSVSMRVGAMYLFGAK